MSSSIRWLPLLIGLAILSYAASITAAERTHSPSNRYVEALDDSAAVEEAPELMMPETANKRPKTRTAPRSAEPSRSAATNTASNPQLRIRAPADAIVRAPSAATEPRPAAKPKVVRTSSNQELSAATQPQTALPRQAVTRASSTFVEPSQVPFNGPNPEYHPAHVRRGAAGWHLTGAQPAGPPVEPPPALEGHAEEVFPYQGDSSTYDGFGGGCQGDCQGDCGDGCAMPCGSGGGWAWIAGGEALWLRSHYSEATALTRIVTSQQSTATTFNDTMLNFDPSYQGGFRTYLGLRDCCCGDEVRFGFFHYNSIDRKNATATADTGYCDFLCNSTGGAGDSIHTSLSNNVSIWDLDFIRPFYFNGGCGDCCGPACPPWDLRWFGGLRIGYVNHYIDSVVNSPQVSNGIAADGHSSNKFTGFGPRMGLQARRYFGCNGEFSLYARGAGSLLVGNVAQYVNNFNVTGQGLGPVTNIMRSSNARVIPVAELEIGASWWVLPRLALSGGWMLQSWWDLGLQEIVNTERPLDDSNIFALDGFFLRAELTF